VSPPLTLTSTYRAGGGATYGRDHNSTWGAFEAALGGLEGGTALAFSSGMAAIAAVLESLPLGSGVVMPTDAYQGTRLLLGDMVTEGRLAIRAVDIADTDATLAACAEVAGLGAGGLLWIESPTNPLLAIADLSSLTAGAQEQGLQVAVDSTIATPLLQRPLDLGADVVVHSVTKLLAGHSDVVMGAAVTRESAMIADLTRRRSLRGAIPGPFETLLALRGMRTLAVRLERAQANSAELARRLAARSGVYGVRYPGLPDHPGHELARKQMRGFGAMIAFEVTGGAEAAEALCQALRVIIPATSLGGVESLIERRGRYPAESHLSPALLRLSVGIEHVEDLWADLDQACQAAGVG
jgi:cystathionine gamma-synthase